MTKLMMMAASLRKDSVNKKLLAQTEAIAKGKKISVDHADFADFAVPNYNQDDLDEKGLPASIKQFIARMKAADGLVIVSPEYNFSIPGTLKNLIDWVSRDVPMPWDERHVLLLSASPALAGGNRGLWAARVPLECCGAFVYPKMFSLPQAYEAFAEDGTFKDSKNIKRIETLLDGFCKCLK